MHELSPARKAALAVQTLSNWPVLAADKSGIRPELLYRTRSGLRVVCRARTPDVHELVAIMSGHEYPGSISGVNRVVFDVGANIGCFSLWILKQSPHALPRVFAFEPFAPNATILQRNLELNGFGNTVVEQRAVAGTDGWAWLDSNRPVDEIRLDTEGDVKVETITLSSYCDRAAIETIDLLKLDVEGAEYEILEKDRRFVCDRVRRIVLEYHDGFVPDPLAFFTSRFSDYFGIEFHRPRGGCGVLSMVNKRL